MAKKKTKKWDRMLISLDPKTEKKLSYLQKKYPQYSTAAIIRDAIDAYWYNTWVDEQIGAPKTPKLHC